MDNRKVIFVIAVMLIAYVSALSQTQSKPANDKKIELTLQLLKCQVPPVTSVPEQDTLPDVRICIKNHTDTAAAFFEDWNSWGHDAVSLELTINDSTITLHHGGGCWDKNYPSCVLLFPGDSVVFYYRVLKCFKRGPCSCFYNMPKGSVFPMTNLSGVSARAAYQVNMENYQQFVTEQLSRSEEFRDVLIMHCSHPVRCQQLTIEQRLQSFVKNKLISEPVTICFDSW